MSQEQPTTAVVERLEERSQNRASSQEDMDAARTTQRVILRGISWATYQHLLRELGDHRASRLAYTPGVLEITMPSDRHETQKKLLERMIETLTDELALPAKAFGSMTLNRDDLERGAEPDSCYYIQHAGAITGRQVDLMVDPPPDLILEMGITSPSSRRMEIYQRLGVPELWCYAAEQVHIYSLHEGAYVACTVSPTFPLVSPAIVTHFLAQAVAQDDTTFIRAWRHWIRQQRASGST